MDHIDRPSRRIQVVDCLAWLLPLSPAVAGVLLLWLLPKAKMVWHGLRQQKVDLILWGLIGLFGLVSVVGAYDKGRAISNWPLPFVIFWLYALGRWAIPAPKRFFVYLLRGTASLAVLMIIGKLWALDWRIGNVVILGEFAGVWGRGNVLGVASNGLGLLLEVGVVGGMALLTTARRLAQRLEMGTIAALSFWALLISQSRGAWVGVTVGILVTAVFFTPRVLALLGAGIAAAAAVSEQWRFRLASIFSYAPNQERFEIWQGAVAMIRDHFWFGIGPGNFGRVYPRYAIKPNLVTFGSPHNNYMYVLSMWGIFGALLFFGWQAWVMIRSLRRGLTPHQKAIWATLIAFFVHGLFDDLIAPTIPLLLGLLENEGCSYESNAS